jgi:hypothetical protein
MVVAGNPGESSACGFDLTLGSQKPTDRAGALGVHEPHDTTLENHAIKTGVAEQDGIAMMMKKAVHGGPPRGVGVPEYLSEVHYIHSKEKGTRWSPAKGRSPDKESRSPGRSPHARRRFSSGPRAGIHGPGIGTFRTRFSRIFERSTPGPMSGASFYIREKPVFFSESCEGDISMFQVRGFGKPARPLGSDYQNQRL